MKRIPFLSSVSMVILTMVISGVMSCSTDAESQTDQLDSQLSAVELQTILETDRWTGAADEILTQLYLNSQIPSGKFADEQCEKR